jgi:radical SAM superfamily enzyme YgiQ (UPF0313 family)
MAASAEWAPGTRRRKRKWRLCGGDKVVRFEIMRIVLISTYELGRQPFGLASPAAWLRAEGAEVKCLDVSREELDEEAVRGADLIAFYVPMHTATRLAVALLRVVRAVNAGAHVCFYGLYAPVNEAYLRRLGVETILGGEFEAGLASLARRLSRDEEKEGARDLRFESSNLKKGSREVASVGANGGQTEPVISLERLKFLVPDRSGMVALRKYAQLTMPDGSMRTVGYTEASRGCKHLCRHCPIVPVYGGAFRVVERDVVLEDVRRQVAAGAEHVTFGDPDFFNGVGHAVRLVQELHREFPALTYDVTIKVEHLLKHRAALKTLFETGCLFVTSAVESVDDAVLERLEKNHTRADFLDVVRLCREAGLVIEPTFVAFTPWTTLESYCEMLEVLRAEELIENVAPIQLAIRLLIPSGSRLLELGDVRTMVGEFDEEALVYPWRNADTRVDELCRELQGIVHAGEKLGLGRGRVFGRIEEAAFRAAGRERAIEALPTMSGVIAVPHLNEAWYC